MANILVVDDEIGIRELLSEILNDEGHAVVLAENASRARLLKQQDAFDLVLLDIWMPDTDGVTLLKEWVSSGQLTCPVIMMSGHATIDTAVQATRIGAMDFLEKPIALQKLLKAVQAGLARGKQAPSPPPMNMGLPPTVSSRAAPNNTGFSSVHPPHQSLQQHSSQHSANVFGSSSLSSSQGFGSATGLMQHPAISTSNAVDLPDMMAFKGSQVQVGVHNLSLDQPLREARDAFERVYFEYHLARENYSMTRVAERTGLERTHLYRKLKQLGIELGRTGRRSSSD